VLLFFFVFVFLVWGWGGLCSSVGAVLSVGVFVFFLGGWWGCGVFVWLLTVSVLCCGRFLFGGFFFFFCGLVGLFCLWLFGVFCIWVLGCLGVFGFFFVPTHTVLFVCCGVFFLFVFFGSSGCLTSFCSPLLSPFFQDSVRADFSLFFFYFALTSSFRLLFFSLTVRMTTWCLFCIAFFAASFVEPFRIYSLRLFFSLPTVFLFFSESLAVLFSSPRKAPNVCPHQHEDDSFLFPQVMFLFTFR